MILIDTHIWIWWVNGSSDLPTSHRDFLEGSRTDGVGISAFSCWEVAKLVEKGRLVLTVTIDSWMNDALSQRGLTLIPLTPEISIESTRLPGNIHSDPADQIIVATSRIHDLPLMTMDGKILAYSHVRLWSEATS